MSEVPLSGPDDTQCKKQFNLKEGGVVGVLGGSVGGSAGGTRRDMGASSVKKGLQSLPKGLTRFCLSLSLSLSHTSRRPRKRGEERQASDNLTYGVLKPQRFGNDLYQGKVLQPRVCANKAGNGSNGVTNAYL